MIFRTYDRRGGGFADGVSDSSSQESSQGVYDFTFPTDPYNFNSSQESGQLAFLPPRKGGGDCDDKFRKSKKLKMIEAGSKTYGTNSSQESKRFGDLRISDGDFQKPKKSKKAGLDPYDTISSQELEKFATLSQIKGKESSVFDFTEDGDLWESKKSKNVDSDSYVLNSSQELSALGISQSRKRESHWGFDGISGKSKKKDKVEINPDPYGYNSSQGLEDFAVLPQRNVKENSVFDFSEDGDLWELKKSKNVDSDSYLLNSSQELGDLGISQSRKREVNGNYWDFGGVSGKSKKKDRGEIGVLQKKKKKKKMKSKESEQSYVELTATLMETQESGEMMEHEDEVNFALDGLKGGQPVRIRRASLLSLLSICGTVQQRRHLKIHGMAKTIIDAVLGLTFDDMPSNLAAAALVYILTIDGQDDHLRDSPNFIRFLIKMLKPLSSSAVKEKALPIGSKLLSLCKNVGFLQESAKGTDSSSTAIMLKVREILVSCKEMKPRDDIDGGGIEEPELNPKWISLLTMEKACSSRISIEDTSGIRKTGGKFKEKLREFGGLDAVFEVARKCHSVMEEWVEKSPTFSMDSREILGLESLVLLLKCLKIMENALFLSNDNQRHLLGMKGNFDGQRAPRSFTKLVLSVIKILSGVSLLRSSSTSSQNEKTGCISYGMELTSQESFAQYDLGIKPSAGPTEGSADALLLKLRAESSQSGLCSGTSRNSKNSEDPFAFGDDGFEPSKWDFLSGSSNKSLSQDSRAAGSQYRYENQSVPLSSQQESNDVEYRHTQGAASCSSAVDGDKLNLLADCLLTAVKVLMNLTNDNPEGCRQIATCGGLEILSSLIAGHFSSFSTSRDSNLTSKASPKIDQRSNSHLTDREMDFLVALLGLLVNLVEKDSRNRSRLAAATVSLPNMEGSDSEDQSDVISLLCSIFLANQGNNEAPGEETYLSLEDEDSILQGEKEAEKMIVEAYAALLLAFLSTESQNVRNAIAQCLPNHNLKTLVPVLERFLEFHMTLNMISPETHTAVLEVIESCRIP
ncbi:hypothetical protein PHJA_001883100 [Phtheirospermum japonicum]|uniref:WAPL domain-containing protein n=1 Tax=Phtheirospermum japonicum TaxID=374723 RepID=A0A830CCQ0_9LAMI|nr:hypothetical protein PHJA_001883100 [Phtheirospermum japonicum]